MDEKYAERWEKLQELQQTVTSELEKLWNKESDGNANWDGLKITVGELKEKVEKLNEQLKSYQTAQASMASEIKQLNQESVELAKTLLVTNPREKYMDQLITNITKVKWALCNDESSGVINGTIMSSQPPKKFQFNPGQKSAETVCSELWSLLTEGDKFL